MLSARSQLMLDRVLLFHEQTKHRSDRYARSLGRMDWGNQPDPFRRYEGATLTLLSPTVSEWLAEIEYDSVFTETPAVQALSRDSMSQFFLHSLSVTAWKESGLSRWALRVNPSSGNLHPTEAYLLSGPIEDLYDVPTIAHYDPYYHGLETRLELSLGEWNQFAGALPEGGFLIGLASIPWREAWKYGERSYRYCQHDIGHAIACLQVGARLLGWDVQPLDQFLPEQMDVLMGLQNAVGSEAENGVCLLVVSPVGSVPKDGVVSLRCTDGFFNGLRSREWMGEPNVLSRRHHHWPILDLIEEAVAESGHGGSFQTSVDQFGLPQNAVNLPARASRSATTVIRGRRSAVAFEGDGRMRIDDFYRLLLMLHPALTSTWTSLSSTPNFVSLAFFVHRVDGLEPGLYLLCRADGHYDALVSQLRSNFLWEKPVGCPDEIPFYLLREGDFAESARLLSCHQSIASDGFFAVAMLTEFRPALETHGAGLYPRLFWEAGMIGQFMYLEAEAAGWNATGIGCFLDDGVHQLLGIADDRWQVIYHFTVGKAVVDERLRTIEAYAHRNPSVMEE